MRRVGCCGPGLCWRQVGRQQHWQQQYRRDGRPRVACGAAGRACRAAARHGRADRVLRSHAASDCALIDADKYLRRGSLWEAHNRLHEARHHIWALWAAATGALYPWHGMSQVLDHDPRNLPPGIESTVAGLDTADLRRATRASAALLTKVSASAAHQCPADLPSAMAGYVTHALSRDR